ncbi:unnamed protein product, partial [Ectocarpus sp. 12 AP-2014]
MASVLAAVQGPPSGFRPMKDTEARWPLTVVVLSETLDLISNMSDAQDPRIKLVRPEDVDDPGAVTCALSWRPAADAFDPYPNIKMVSSIAAGVDSIISCPSLPQDITVTRVRDEDQARMMAGFATWHVIHHHRQMGVFLANQKKHLWERGHRPRMSPEVTVGVLGFGLMGQHTARVLADMGYKVLAASRSGGKEMDGVEVISGPDAISNVAARAELLVNLLPLTE